MPRLRSLIALAALALSTSACSVDCTDYTNRTSAAAPVRDAADIALGTATLGLYENTERGERHMLFTLDAPFGSGGAPLRGHVLGGRLIRPDGSTLVELDPSAPTVVMHGVINNYLPLASEQAVADVRTAMLTGNTRVVIETDLPGRERLEARLSSTSHQPYQRRRCPRYS